MSGLFLHRVDDTSEELETALGRTEGRVGLGELLDDLPRPLRRSWAPGRAVHEAWRLDARDQLDLRWWPQGISTIADAGDDELPDGVRGRRLVVMSSYAKQLPWHDAKHGSRVTFLDLERNRYRHVLLVRPTGEGGLEPLHAHAGGVLWHRGRLHVAATGRGLYTCLLDDLTRVASPADAFGYRYVLPVRWHYRATADDGVERLRYSFLSLDRSGDRPAAYVGEYTKSETQTRRIARFELDPATGLLQTGADDRTWLEGVGDGPLRMQGVASARGRLHLSVSEGRVVPGSIYAGTPGDLRHHRWATPMGNEDLDYHPGEDLLYSVSEHPTARFVFTMRRGWFDLAR